MCVRASRRVGCPRSLTLFNQAGAPYLLWQFDPRTLHTLAPLTGVWLLSPACSLCVNNPGSMRLIACPVPCVSGPSLPTSRFHHRALEKAISSPGVEVTLCGGDRGGPKVKLLNDGFTSRMYFSLYQHQELPRRVLMKQIVLVLREN